MGEKKIKGRKRHIVTDTQGHLLCIKVDAANIHDTVAGCNVFKETLRSYPSLKAVCGDAGYRKTMEDFVKNILKKSIFISKRIVPDFVILAKRWVVERTFAWLNHFRRLSKDYEIRVKSAENIIMIAHSMILIRRLA
jgi:putative transposase